LSHYDIYGLGAALVDTEVKVTDAELQGFGIAKGVMTLVDEARQHQLLQILSDHLCRANLASGGSAANSIIAAQYFGAKTFYSCKVAKDTNGQFYLKDLANAGVTYPQNAGCAEGITGKCLVMITDDAERTMNTFLGISETLSVAEIDESALKASKYVYIEGYLVTSVTGRPAAVRLRELAKQNGVRTALSLSDPAIVTYFRDGLVEMVGDGVDILFCNRAEALNYTGCGTLEEAAQSLQTWAKSFAITLGAEGALVFDGERQFTVPAPKVTAVDSNGAGDMFAGAFLFAITQGANFEAAASLAVKAAAQVVAQYGPRLRPEQHRPILDQVKW
jgi:sugar/nucleoside kinase (ribokinase family)